MFNTKANIILEICYGFMSSIINKEDSITVNARFDEYLNALEEHKCITEEQHDRLLLAFNNVYNILNEIK